MTAIDIKEHLNSKANAFLSLFSLELQSKLSNEIYFAGGCIYSLSNDKDVKDYDIFLMSDELIEELKQLGIWNYTSEYALTTGKFQIVIKYFGEPDSCVCEFDFKHNMHYYIPFSNFICSCNAEDGFSEFEEYKYINTNELFFNENRARDIEGVYLRIEKFLARGMTISKDTKKKIKKRTTKKAVRDYKKKRSGNRNCY